MHILAFNNKKSRVSVNMLFSEFKKKEVINLKNCQKLGRVADFESALKDVAGMESYEEAEEYFYTEWNLDPESPVVKGFLDVISKCSNLN